LSTNNPEPTRDRRGNHIGSAVEIDCTGVSEETIFSLAFAVCGAIDLDDFCGLDWSAYYHEGKDKTVIEIRPGVVDLSRLTANPNASRVVGLIQTFDLSAAIEELREIYDRESSIPFSFYCSAVDGEPNFSADGTVGGHAVSVAVFDGEPFEDAICRGPNPAEIMAPYGYRFRTDGVDKWEVTGLEEVPEEAAVVQKIAQWVIEGWSLHRIMSQLISDQVQPPFTAWSVAVLTRILRDKIYSGQFRLRESSRNRALRGRSEMASRT
jgi:hypothetical protein